MIELGDAGLHGGPDLVCRGRDELEIIGQLAIEARERATRAALIEEQNVTLAPDRLEGSAQLEIEVDPAAARSAVDQNERIRRRVRGQGRNAREKELECRSVGSRVVFGHR